MLKFRNKIFFSRLSILENCILSLIIFFSIQLVIPNSASSELKEFFSATGKLFISVDGGGSVGTTGSKHTIFVDKPSDSAKVRKAFVLAASQGFRTQNRPIGDGEVILQVPGLDRAGINWDAQVPGTAGNFNHRADVTSLIKPAIDQAPPGRFPITFIENFSEFIEGEILAVIFDDTTQNQDSTVILLFGQQATSGDAFTISLNNPLNPADPSAFMNMGVGISNSLANVAPPNPNQVHLIDINGARLTSAAGGNDDGEGFTALITVGGFGDSLKNPPDKFASPGTDERFDDELYSLLPFVKATTRNIKVNTQNPTNDDNLFFTYFQISSLAILDPGIMLTPTSATNDVGTDHTVKATVLDVNGNPVPSVLVEFSIDRRSPNAEQSGTALTDSNGVATFTYTSNGEVGTDVIQAFFFNGNERIDSNIASKKWILPTATLTLTTAGTGTGTTTGAGTYEFGATATVTAAPATGSRFEGWSGAHAAECTSGAVVMDADKQCTATFTALQPTLTLTTAGTGTGTTTGAGSYEFGATATVTAAPATGSRFEGWSGACTGTNPTTTVQMNENSTCTATFTALQPTLTLTTAGTGTGTTTGAGTYEFGATATVTAAPATGSRFEGWSGAHAAECTSGAVVMDADKQCTATFTALQPTLTLTTAGTGTGTTTGAGSYEFGATATVTAAPATGSRFEGWSGAHAAECTSGSVVMDADKQCTATFSVDVVTVPNVVGQTQTAATAAINGVDGLSVGTISQEDSTSVAAGSVIRQDPSPGPVDRGTTVVLVVSTGPPPVVIDTVDVPNVVGQTQTAASSAIAGAGLTVGGVSTVASTSPEGSVLEQAPESGAAVSPGTAVSLVVSSGPNTTDVDVFTDGVDINPGDQICETATGGCTLRAAIQEANALGGAQTIILSPGTYQLTVDGANEDAAATGDLDITGPLTIARSTGETDAVIIDGGALSDRVFDLPQASPITVTLRDLTIQGGQITGSTGGGIRNVSGNLTIEGSVIRNNGSNGSGGGISHLGGTLALQDTMVQNNTSEGRGGGVQAQEGTVTITATTLENNTANFGGGLSTGNANVTVIDSQVTTNRAAGGGGGIYKFLHPGDLFAGITAPAVRLEGTTLQGNTTNDCEGYLINGPGNSIGNPTRCHLQNP